MLHYHNLNPTCFQLLTRTLKPVLNPKTVQMFIPKTKGLKLTAADTNMQGNNPTLLLTLD